LNKLNQIKKENPKQKIYCVSIDIAKCFDSVSHELIRISIKKFIKNPIVRNFLIKYYTGNGRGVYQGDPLSPILFGYITHFLIEKIEWLSEHTQMFADDLILIMKGDIDVIKLKISLLYEIIKEFGMTPNKKKTIIQTDISKVKYLGIWLERKIHIIENQKKAQNTFNRYRFSAAAVFPADISRHPPAAELKILKNE